MLARAPAETTPLALLRRWVNDYFNRHDASACAGFVAEDYALAIGDTVLTGRDEAWLPAVDVQMQRFPGLTMTVHETAWGGSGGEGWAAAWFSEHGRSEGRTACWSGVALYRSRGERLTGCVAQEDYWTRARQLKSGMADPVDPPAAAPWDVAGAPRDERAEAVVRRWLDGAWPKEPAIRADDEHLTGTALRFEVAETAVGTLLSSGPHVAFHAVQTGRYLGGLSGVEGAGREARLHVNGLVRVADGAVVSGRVIRDRAGLAASLRPGVRQGTRQGMQRETGA